MCCVISGWGSGCGARSQGELGAARGRPCAAFGRWQHPARCEHHSAVTGGVQRIKCGVCVTSSSTEGIARFFLMCNEEKMIQIKICSWDGAGKQHGGGAGGGRASGPPPPLHPFSCPRVHPLGGFCQNPLQARALPKCLPSPPLPAPPSGSTPQRPNTSGFHGSLIFNEHRSRPNRNESVSLMRAGHAGISPGRQQLPPKLAPSARGGFFFYYYYYFQHLGPASSPCSAGAPCFSPMWSHPVPHQPGCTWIFNQNRALFS